jgi:hypothetical protein
MVLFRLSSELVTSTASPPQPPVPKRFAFLITFESLLEKRVSESSAKRASYDGDANSQTYAN